MFLYIIYFVECPCVSLSCCEFESHSGKVYSIQHYVIKFVSDLWQVWGFLQFPLPIKHNWNIVESGVKHHNPNPILSIIWSFSLISTTDIFIINELTLILKIIGQCDVKHIMMLPFKTITWVLKVLTYYTITSIAACPTRLTMILVIMSVSTFKMDITLQNVYTNNSILFPLWRTNILLYSGINIVIFFCVGIDVM